MKKQQKTDSYLFTYLNPPPRFYEENDGSSITNQDVGMSISDMIAAHARGEDIELRNVHYDDDEDMITKSGDFDLADITAANELLAAARSRKPSGDSITKDDEGNGVVLDATSGASEGEGGTVPKES